MKRNETAVDKFFTTLTVAAHDFALLFAHTPDERARAHLTAYVASIRPDIVAAVGGGRASIILEAFETTVMARKRELEVGAFLPIGNSYN